MCFTSREFGHRIKMISMATFKPEEIEKLKRIGNDNARKIWLAKWTPSEFPEPDPTRHKQIREFMQAKYVAKKWLDPAMKDAIENGKPLPVKAAPAPAPATTSTSAAVCPVFFSLSFSLFPSTLAHLLFCFLHTAPEGREA